MRVIYSLGSVSVNLSFQPTEETLGILSQTVYGTEGLKYRHKISPSKVSNLSNPHFFSLYVDGKLAGNFCLCERSVYSDRKLHRAFYGRYLSILPAFQGKGYGYLLKEQACSYIKQTYTDPFIIYSFIEEKNVRSMNLSKKQGNQCIGTYEALSFSRLKPVVKKGFEPMGIPDNEMSSLLKNFYQNYSLVHVQHAGYGNNYFCIRKDGRIVAGVQATPVEWEIVSIQGFSGAIVMNILPHVPYLNRLFNPKSYRFAAFEAVYFEAGYEDELLALLESALAYLNLYSGIFFGDSSCAVTSTLKHSGSLGLLSKVNESTKAMVMASSYHTEQSLFNCNNRIYISAFDQT